MFDVSIGIFFFMKNLEKLMYTYEMRPAYCMNHCSNKSEYINYGLEIQRTLVNENLITHSLLTIIHGQKC